MERTLRMCSSSGYRLGAGMMQTVLLLCVSSEATLNVFTQEESRRDKSLSILWTERDSESSVTSEKQPKRSRIVFGHLTLGQVCFWWRTYEWTYECLQVKNDLLRVMRVSEKSYKCFWQHWKVKSGEGPGPFTSFHCKYCTWFGRLVNCRHHSHVYIWEIAPAGRWQQTFVKFLPSWRQVPSVTPMVSGTVSPFPQISLFCFKGQ